jgi:hypothetical protein
MSEAVKQECAAIERHIKDQGYTNIPVTLRGRNSVQVFSNHMEIGLDVPEEALAFTLAVINGCAVGTLAQVLSQAPFDLHNFFDQHTYDDGFSYRLPTDEVINIRSVYSKVFQAFAIHDPEQLKRQAPAIQTMFGETTFAIMEAGVPEVEMAHIMAHNLRLCRQDQDDASYTGMYEHMLSETQYLLMFDNILPNGNAGDFLVKSGVLSPDFINSVMNRNYFWEGVFHAATALRSARSHLANQLAMHLVFKLKDSFAGTMEHVVRSLDFAALESKQDRLDLFNYIFKRIPGNNPVLGSTLLQVGLLAGLDFDVEKPFFPQAEVLSMGIENLHLQRFMAAPHHLMHNLLCEINDLPQEQIGLSVFTKLNFLARQALPEQEFDEALVSAVTLKLASALSNLAILHAPGNTMKARVDEQAFAGLRSFNQQFLQRWGFDYSIFENATTQERDIAAIAGFELITLENIMPGSLSRRLESDLGL